MIAVYVITVYVRKVITTALLHKDIHKKRVTIDGSNSMPPIARPTHTHTYDFLQIADDPQSRRPTAKSYWELLFANEYKVSARGLTL